MPEPVVFKATADRISRLPYGSLFVSFHSRIAEAVQMATILAVAGPVTQAGVTPPERLLDERIAKDLATAWLDVCNIARTILRRDKSAPQLADASIAATLAELDATLGRVGPVFNVAANRSASAEDAAP
jgi:hypothetical protein